MPEGISFHNLLPPDCSCEYRYGIESGLYAQAMEVISDRIADGRKYIVQILPFSETPMMMHGICWSRIELSVVLEEVEED